MQHAMLPDSTRAILRTELGTAQAVGEMIPLERVRGWQNRLYLGRLLQLADNPLSWQAIWVHQVGDLYFILDGHHRAVVAELRGDTRIRALVWK